MKTSSHAPWLLSFALCVSAASVGCDGPSAVPPPQPGAATPAGSGSAHGPDAAPSAEAHHHPHWTYGGDEGPSHWGDLSPEWSACKTGTRQTPIDIVTGKTDSDRGLSPLVVDYPALPLAVLNNGHTVQVNAAAGSLRAAGDTWKLAQFHFHSPSEHMLDGKHAELELHLVHKNDRGALAVVGLLFKKGKANLVLASVFDNAPAEVSKEAKTIEGQTVDVGKLLPAGARYFTYEGSLTTPPCSEGVRWLVLDTMAEVSEDQIAQFRKATHGDTARPVQSLGARHVTRPN
jgi:carbonic anhydrase